MVVHFPVALLLAALVIETLAILLGKAAWHRVSLWNLVLGTMGAAVAVLTGRLAMTAAKHSMEIYRVMQLHERLGYVVLGLAVTVIGWRFSTRDRLSNRSRRAAWFLLAVACGTMAFAAHLGGRLVYEFGVGGIYGRAHGIQIQ